MKYWSYLIAIGFIFIAATLAFESMDASTMEDSAEDYEERFPTTQLGKDTILRKNPQSIGNILKDLWERIPENEIDSDIK